MRSIVNVILFSIFVMTLSSCGNNSKQGKEDDEIGTNEVVLDQSRGNNESEALSSALNSQESEESDGKVYTEIISNGKPTIIDFNATWCGPCKYMAPIFHKLAKEYGDKFNFVSIDVDENNELADKYHIQSIPAFIFLDESGKECNRMIGRVEESELRDELENPTWM